MFDYDDKARDNFNPRSLAGATVTMLVMLSALAYFNPRSLAGATRGPKGDTGPQGISIHAPSRERLCLSVPLVKLRIISIHAPSRERHAAPKVTQARKEFQSTLPRGSDCASLSHWLNCVLFQSTLPRGSDYCFRLINLLTLQFQSTLPRGSDDDD